MITLKLTPAEVDVIIHVLLHHDTDADYPIILANTIIQQRKAQEG